MFNNDGDHIIVSTDTFTDIISAILRSTPFDHHQAIVAAFRESMPQLTWTYDPIRKRATFDHHRIDN